MVDENYSRFKISLSPVKTFAYIQLKQMKQKYIHLKVNDSSYPNQYLISTKFLLE